MKKRLLSILLIPCMVLALLPGTALAATEISSSLTVTPTGIRADSVANSAGYGSLTLNGNWDDYELWQIMDEEYRDEIINPQIALVDRDGNFVFPYRENADEYGRNIGYHYSDGIVSLTYGAYTYEGFPEYYRLDGTKAFPLEESRREEPDRVVSTSYIGGNMNDGYAIIAEMNSWSWTSTGGGGMVNGTTGGASLHPTVYRIVDKNGNVTGELPEAFSKTNPGYAYSFDTELMLNTLCGEGLFAFFEMKWDEDFVRYGYVGKGYLDTTGKTVIDLDGRGYINLAAFSSGLAAVVTDYGVGFIDKTGAEVIHCVYDSTGNFSSDGLVSAKKDGKWGYIDKTGKTVIPFEYDDAYGAGGGLASVVRNGKCGLVDYSNNVVLPLEYDDISSYEGGVAYAIKDGYLYIVSEGAPAMNETVVRFTNEMMVDDGMLYNYTITNYTQERMTGYYTLLTYLIHMDAITGEVAGQFIVFDLDLAPGQSVSGQIKSADRWLSLHKLCWTKFDSKEERDAFLQDSKLYNYFDIFHNTDNFPEVYVIKTGQTLDWLSGKVQVKLG